MAAPTRALSVLLCLGVVWEWAAAADAAERGAAAAGVMAPRAEQAPELLLWQEIPTVVSASRHEEPASRAPNAVSVITADQIHQSGLMTLGDLLRLAVGVDVARISGGVYGVGVRGLYGVWENSTLVLMDGRTLYTPVWGGVQWAEQPVLLEDIERIEVVRGPGGAAWGANAANGVINIITKKPADTQGLTLSQTLTSRLDSLTYMQYSETFEKLDLRLSAGYDSMPEVGVRHGPGNHDFVRMPRASLRSIYHLDEERSLDFDAGYVDGVRGNVGLANGFTSARWFPQTHFIRTRYTHEEADDDLWYVQYFLNRTTTDMSDGGLWARYIKHDIEVQRTRRAAEQHVLTWGGNLRLDYLTNGDPFTPGLAGLRFDNRRTRNVQAGLFLQDRFEVSDQWTLVGGVRTDHNSYTGWEWAGRGTVLYHPVPEHTFRASVARAFRTPTLTDRTFNLRAGPLPFPLPPFAMLLRGNHDLNPTYVKAYEFGYAYEKQPVRLGADFFWNNYRGIVAGVPQTAPGALPARRRPVRHRVERPLARHRAPPTRCLVRLGTVGPAGDAVLDGSRPNDDRPHHAAATEGHGGGAVRAGGRPFPKRPHVLGGRTVGPGRRVTVALRPVRFRRDEETRRALRSKRRRPRRLRPAPRRGALEERAARRGGGTDVVRPVPGELLTARRRQTKARRAIVPTALRLRHRPAAGVTHVPGASVKSAFICSAVNSSSPASMSTATAWPRAVTTTTRLPWLRAARTSARSRTNWK